VKRRSQKEREPTVQKQGPFLQYVLLVNGIVDLGCVIFLAALPLLARPLLGYSAFDLQGSFMAGGWAIAALALGVTRIWTSSRAQYHAPMRLMGLLEGSTLAVFVVISLCLARVTLVQALLPLAVGALFGAAYLVELVTHRQEARDR
jgi:hypothetical protein